MYNFERWKVNKPQQGLGSIGQAKFKNRAKYGQVHERVNDS